ncbi:MAG TPA: DUF4124 domain-containing protein [Noviherbaspirillum sp.]
MKTVRILQIAVGTLLAALCASEAALAQYVWVDEKGVKQFSDMPPPTSVPTGRILKQPNSPLRPAFQAGGTAPDAPNADTAQAPKTIAEQNAEYKKRRAEQAEKEQKAAEEAKLAADKAKNCDRARDYQRILESGERIVRTDKSGERTLLTDGQRSQEMRDNRQILKDCK